MNSLTISRSDYALRIRALIAAGIESVLAIGHLLIEAKAALPHGDFEAMVEQDLGWSPSTAQRLMAVARHPLLSKAAHGQLLPSSWRTLYELTRLPESVLQKALADGRITSDMQRSSVAKLLLAEEVISVESPTATAAALETMILSRLKYGCIYADPPWSYGNQATRAATDNHYITMDVDAICSLPIRELAAPDAHLHLWTTNAFLFDAARVIEAWGFTYKSCFVWVKPQMGIGNYWRVSHEFLLFAKRGDAPFRDRGLMSWGEYDRTEHSAKPEEVRLLIERASPTPRLELFGRRVVEGWTVWGNEIGPGSLWTPVPEEVA